MIGPLLRCAAVAAFVVVLVPSASAASPLDIPAVVPPKFRPLVREGLRSGKHTSPPAAASRFALKTRQGYKVVVIAVRNIVALEVARARSHESKSLKQGRAFTAYVAHGTVSGGRIEAKFGSLGRVSMRFHPSGRVAMSKPLRHCNGAHRYTRRFGSFAGTVRFTGEDRYVAVRAHRAKGVVRSPIRLDCTSGHFHSRPRRFSRQAGNWPKFTPTILAAFWRQAVSSTDFFSFQVGQKSLYLAVSEESKGAMAEVHIAAVVAHSKTLVADDALTSATVKPPAPFHGKGSYSAAPDGTKSWTGSLSVAFPGEPGFPLTGTQFEPLLATGF
jgi:hypothetical protein